MKIKVSDYIADFLVGKGLRDVFTVPGGGAMYLNDSLGHHPDLKSIYNHHEQASAIAAEAYARVNGKMAILCVTSGPGGINALNGVAGAYQDSIPMIILSGQVKRTLTTRYTGINVRTLGGQEFDIISAVGKMTKYAEMIDNPSNICYCLEKAYYTALDGRMGPCWLDIPLDVQGAYIDTDELAHFDNDILNTSSEDIDSKINIILEKLTKAKRPVIYAGNEIQLHNGKHVLHRVAERYNIPIVTCWDSIDLIDTANDLYCGRAGTMGDRAGNFAVQNSDLLICVGNRLNIYQVGYDVKTWAREAYVVVVENDENELKKPTIHIDLSIISSPVLFLEKFLNRGLPILYNGMKSWIKQCNYWKYSYPVVQAYQYQESERVNIYAFIDTFSKLLPEDAITVVANGSASVVGSQTYYIKKNSKFIMNCALSSMGYELPAAEGACIASGYSPVYCIAGDGSIMMNLQELQTIISNEMPIKIIVINNEGYHQIRQTQNNIFKNKLIGVGPESGDISFPDLKKLAFAFGYEYIDIVSNNDMCSKIKKIIEYPLAMICEVKVTTSQNFEPKLSSKKLQDGSFVSPPLEDLYPFLSREELESNMYIPLV